ncbi:hypothetical protein EVAR_64383_1 [Eumeta japonica]|uniref:Uncharacterized protein n=1 Tax=Eumeta variegata TaxID=151549 RepID=A0A4C1SFX3_EUMVA|nr:hypothetical protein EVAR_64383_1 [Eumeta japonica]
MVFTELIGGIIITSNLKTQARHRNDYVLQPPSESLEILMDTHFPGCKDVPGNSTDNTRTPYMICQDIISHEKISWAIDSFSPFKSPLPNGVMTVMLQKAKAQRTIYRYGSARSHVSDREIPWF